MGETNLELEDLFALKFEAHLLGCASIAGFSDERQDIILRLVLCHEYGWRGRNVILEAS